MARAQGLAREGYQLAQQEKRTPVDSHHGRRIAVRLLLDALLAEDVHERLLPDEEEGRREQAAEEAKAAKAAKAE